jgi:uncharacterized protein GlcG (DUF336 family)
VAAAAGWASERGLRLGIVVLDARFVPACAMTMDGAYASVFNVARAKAKTALNFGAPTADLATRIAPESRQALAGVEPGLMFVGGGLPIRAGDRLLGAIGVSGGSADQDAECAAYALAAVDWDST